MCKTGSGCGLCAGKLRLESGGTRGGDRACTKAAFAPGLAALMQSSRAASALKPSTLQGARRTNDGNTGLRRNVTAIITSHGLTFID